MPTGFGTGSNSYGQFWFGGNTFPGFYFKKNVGVGARRSTQFAPGGNVICNTPQNVWNKYIPGAGVGSSSVATRRAKMIHATSCNNNQLCGRFYLELGQNQIRPTKYTTYNSNFTYNTPGLYGVLSYPLYLTTGYSDNPQSPGYTPSLTEGINGGYQNNFPIYTQRVPTPNPTRTSIY